MTVEFEINTVRELIKFKMFEKGYTITQLAEEVGIDTAVICRNIKGENEPRIETIVKIAKVLDIDLNIFKELDL